MTAEAHSPRPPRPPGTAAIATTGTSDSTGTSDCTGTTDGSRRPIMTIAASASSTASFTPAADPAASPPWDGTATGCGPGPADTPTPITTRWAPSQRHGAPPLRRHPVGGVAPAGGTGPNPVAKRAEIAVVPVEDEAARRVVAQTRAIGQAVLEVLAGSRPAGQLVRWMEPAVHEALVLRAELVRRARDAGTVAGPARHPPRRASGPAASAARTPACPLFRKATITSVHACRVHAQCWEMSLVVAEPGRCRAMAMRLEQRHLQWRVTALQLG